MTRIRSITILCILPICAAMILHAAGCTETKKEFRLSKAPPQQELVTALKSSDADVRYQALVELGKSRAIKDDWAIKGMTLIVETDPIPQMRVLALRTMGRVADRRVVPSALKGLKDADERVRVEAAWLLTQISFPEIDGSGQATAVRDALLLVLSDDTAIDARINAALALSCFLEKKVAIALIAALRDSNFSVRYHAEQALVTMTGRTFHGKAPEWVKFINDTPNPFEHAGETPAELAKPKQNMLQKTRDRIHEFYVDWQGPSKR